MHKTLQHSLVAATLMASAFSAHAETITLKVHHFLGPQSIQHTTMIGDWCKNIERDSKGRLNCQIYPAMQLGGSPPQLFDQAKDGIADIVWTVAGYSGTRFSRIQVFQLPFMMTNAEATSRAAWDFAQKYATDEFKDVKLLAVHVHGPGIIFTREAPITTLADFKGKKLRGPTAQITKMLKNLGATPVPMPVPAVPEALSKGVIDGAVIPYEVAPGLRVQELTNFTSEPDPSYNALYTTVFVVPMNKAKYDSLPADLQAVIDKNSGREYSAFLGKTQAGNDAPGKKKFEAAPNQKITIIPASELKKWDAATADLSAGWVDDMGKRGYKNGQEMLESARSMIMANTK